MKPSVRVVIGAAAIALLAACGSTNEPAAQASRDAGPPWTVGVEAGGRGWYSCIEDSGLAMQSFTESSDMPSSGAGVIFDVAVTEEQARGVLECVLGATDGRVTSNIPVAT